MTLVQYYLSNKQVL